ncbi:MAG TPA: hypothetical protein VF988_05505, partial [Verrucomicrobiae bacterium]
SIEPYHNVTMMVADSPWSGHYVVNPALWAYAHYGQFCKIGWRYLDGGCTNLADGGSLVTLASGSDFSVIAETKGAKTNQQVNFKTAGFSRNKLCVWRSNAKEQFVRLDDITSSNGEFTVTLEPDSIYSISTTSGQTKGGFSDIPPVAAFPFPYRETFDQYTQPELFGFLPRYTADICGGFEIAARPDGNGRCLRQVISTQAQNWAPEWMPYTILGDRDWKDYEVSAEILLDGGGWAGVMGRINGTGSGWGCNPKGYYARLAQDGTVSIWVANSSQTGAPGQQLASGMLANFKAEKWHNLKLRFAGTKISALVDEVEGATATDGTYASGMAGLVSGGEKNTRNTALFDDLVINAVGASKPDPTILAQAVIPMYQTGMTAAQVEAIARQKAVAVTNKTSSAEATSNSQAVRLAAKYVDRFTSGSMAAKQAWDLACASINAGNLNAALSTLEEIRARDDLTPDQITAVTETIAAIQNSSSTR